MEASFSFLLSLSVVFLEVAASTIKIEESSVLEHHLCSGNEIRDNTTLLLTNSIYSLKQGSLCKLNDIGDVSIIANTSSVIKCEGGINLYSNRGFVFHNVTNLRLVGIEFEGCGAVLNDSVIGLTNSTFSIGTCQPSTLVFSLCNNLVLHKIYISQYYGYGIFVLNSYETVLMNNVTVTNNYNQFVNISNGNCRPRGSGVLLLYNGNNFNPQVSVTELHLSSMRIYTNNDTSNNGTINYASTFRNMENVPLPLIGAAGLTVIINERYDLPMNVTCTIDNISLYNNTNWQVGGMLIMFIDVLRSSLHLDNVIIYNNSIMSNLPEYNQRAKSLTIYFLFTPMQGTELPVYPSYQSILIENSYFGGTIKESSFAEHNNFVEVLIVQMPQVAVKYHVKLVNITFRPQTGNPDHSTGMAMYAGSMNGCLPEREFSLELIDIIVSRFSCSVKNSVYSCSRAGVLAFNKMEYISIVNGIFDSNKATSVIISKDSQLNLGGNPVFSNNIAETYGVIQLDEGAVLILNEPINAIFKNNRALLGAAIYGVDHFSSDCIIQFVPSKYVDASNYTIINMTILLQNNVAELAGNSIYASMIYNCKQLAPTLSDSITIPALYKQVFNLSVADSDALSSIAEIICFCDPSAPVVSCSSMWINAIVYPGKDLEVYVTAFDITNHTSVYALVTAQFNPFQTLSNQTFSIPTNQAIARLLAGKCNALEFTILLSQSNASLPQENVIIDLAPYTNTPRSHISVTVKECPAGFMLLNGVCSCDAPFEKQGFTCNIQNGTVNRPNHNIWIGVVEVESNHEYYSTYGYSQQCPSGYCKTGSTTVNLSEPYGLCENYRSGTLCGKCKSGYSSVFGSMYCYQCSDWYIATIVLYIIAGIVLVLLLFWLNLTLRSGTINGLIFYANVISLSTNYLTGDHKYLVFHKVFISLLNLELGFPLCFYSQMSELVARSLQFIFPIYIWTIVIAIIVASRYSSRVASIAGKSSVAVLATLVHLSYAKVFKTAVDLLTYTSIVTEKETFTVWFFDGHITFFGNRHIWLIVISLLFIAGMIIPYTLMSTCAPFLNRFRLVNRFMPLTDTVFAPFKQKYRVWFGLRLCLLGTMFVIAAALLGLNPRLLLSIQLALILAFSLLQSFVKPFKNQLIEVLDLFFMLNFAAIAFVAVYEPQPAGNVLYITTFILISAAFFVFIGIVIYHLWFTSKLLRKLFGCLKICRIIRGNHVDNKTVQNYGAINTDTLSSNTVGVTYVHSDNFAELRSPEDTVGFREPILDCDD